MAKPLPNNLDEFLKGSQSTKVTPPNKSFLADQRIKQQANDGTLVGKAETVVADTVGKGIQNAAGNPVIGAFLNPALAAMTALQEHVIDPISQELSAVALTPLANKGSLAENWAFAHKQAKKISFGQAGQTLAAHTPVGQVISGMIPDSVRPTFMDSDFNIFNDKKRNKAFRDEWAGVLLSGGSDFALGVLGSKGGSAVRKMLTTKAIGSRAIEASAEGLAAYAADAEKAVADIASGNAKRSTLATMIEDVARETRPEVLITHPLVSTSNDVNRAATILSQLTEPAQIKDYLLAEKGDTVALENLFQSAPSVADVLDNYGVKEVKPLWDGNLAQIHEIPDAKLSARLNAVLGDLAKRNPTLAKALDDFAAEKARGIDLNPYQPSRFGSVERLLALKDEAKITAALGEFRPLGEGHWQERVYNTTAYDRTVRFIQWAGSGRAQGHINITNPRKNEAVNDLLSDLNNSVALSGAAHDEFKRISAARFITARTDNERAAVIADIEQETLIRIAKHFGVEGLDDARGDAANFIRRWHQGQFSESRQTAWDSVHKNEGVTVADDGSIVVTDLVLRSNAAQTIPMMDFNKLELELEALLKHRSTQPGQFTGELADTVLGTKQHSLHKTIVSAEEFLDHANFVFSNLNLLRMAYIPKNSIVDPLLRAAMATDSMFGVDNILPGLKNIAYNRTRAIQAGVSRVTNKGTAKRLTKEIAVIRGDIMNSHDAVTAAEKSMAASGAKIREISAEIDELDKLRKKTKDLTAKADIEDKMQELSDLRRDHANTISEQKLLRDEARDARTTAANAATVKREELIAATAKAHGLDAARRYAGEQRLGFEVDGVHYDIPSLADRNVKGTEAFFAELDSGQDFYAAALQSSFQRRVANQASRWVKMSFKENPDGYMNALSHVANRQLRNDEVARMVLEGAGTKQIVDWIYSGPGRKYLAAMSNRLGVADNAVTRDVVEQWADQTSTLIRSMYPDEELRGIILKRKVSTEEMGERLGGRTDLLPEVSGPDVKLMELSPGSRAAYRASAFTEKGWRVLSGVENRLVRNPLFLKYMEDSLKRQVRMARAAGKEVSADLVTNQMRSVAQREALQRVEGVLYSARRQTNIGHYARYVMAFPTAFFNSQVVAAKLIAKNPMNAYWYTRVTQAADVFGTYEDRDGNHYTNLQSVPAGTPVTVTLPFYDEHVPDWMKPALNPYTDSRGGGFKMNPKQLEFMISDPSVAFFGSLGVSELMALTAEHSFLGAYAEDIVKGMRESLGDSVFESSILYQGYPTEGETFVQRAANSMLPGYARSALDTVMAGVFGNTDGFMNDTRFASDMAANYKVAVAKWYRDGMQGTRPNVADSIQSTSLLYGLRAILQFNAPISTTFDPVTAAMTRYYGNAIDANNGDFKLADQQMVENFGIDALALIGSSSKNRAGFRNTNTDIKILRKNKDLVEKIFADTANMELAGMLSDGYSDITKEYSTEVASIYKNMTYPGTGVDLMETKGPEDLYIDPQVRMGWYEWGRATDWRDAKMREYGIKSTYSASYKTSGLYSKMKDLEAQVVAAYPAWDSVRRSAATDFWTQTMKVVNITVSNKKWMKQQTGANAEKWGEIAFWAEQANRFKQALDSLTASRQDTKPLKAAWAEWHNQYVAESGTEFALFANRWLDRMPELRDESDQA